MAPDYRSDRMESPEGMGNARRAWEAAGPGASQAARRRAYPVIDRMAGNINTDLWGFWLIWHLCGGFEGLQRLGLSRSGIYRRVKRFRQVTGYHPDEFEMPGVTIDVAKYRATPTSEVFRSPSS